MLDDLASGRTYSFRRRAIAIALGRLDLHQRPFDPRSRASGVDRSWSVRPVLHLSLRRTDRASGALLHALSFRAMLGQ